MRRKVFGAITWGLAWLWFKFLPEAIKEWGWSKVVDEMNQYQTLALQYAPAFIFAGIGIYLFGYGLWWGQKSSSLEVNKTKEDAHVQLTDATRVCYESVEGTFLGDWVKKVNDTANQRLAYFYASFICNEVPIYGEQTPSRVARQISVNEAKRSVMIDGTNDIKLLGQTEIAYKNVYLLKRDLDSHIDYLKSIKYLNEV